MNISGSFGSSTIGSMLKGSIFGKGIASATSAAPSGYNAGYTSTPTVTPYSSGQTTNTDTRTAEQKAAIAAARAKALATPPSQASLVAGRSVDPGTPAIPYNAGNTSSFDARTPEQKDAIRRALADKIKPPAVVSTDTLPSQASLVAGRSVDDGSTSGNLLLPKEVTNPTVEPGPYDEARQGIDAQEQRDLQARKDEVMARMAAQGITDSGIIEEAMRKVENDVAVEYGKQRSTVTQQELTFKEQEAAKVTERAFVASEADLNRSLDRMKISQEDRRIINQANQFTSKLEFDRWAEQNGVDKATADRNWDMLKTADTLNVQYNVASGGWTSSLANIAATGNVAAAAEQRKIINENITNYWYAKGTTGVALTLAEQADMESDPVARAAFMGGQAGQTLEAVKLKAANDEKYMAARITQLDPKSPGFITDLNAIFRSMGLPIPGNVAAAGTGGATGGQQESPGSASGVAANTIYTDPSGAQVTFNAPQAATFNNAVNRYNTNPAGDYSVESIAAVQAEIQRLMPKYVAAQLGGTQVSSNDRITPKEQQFLDTFMTEGKILMVGGVPYSNVGTGMLVNLLDKSTANIGMTPSA